jgi:hypothetical protein
MLQIIFREILILVLSLAVFPAAVVLLLAYNGFLNVGLTFLAHEMLLGGAGSGGTSISLWLKLLSPYLVVQVIRGFLWSQRSIAGRKWANLYFSVLATSASAWLAWEVWDLFYFMYALGDMPAELTQFFRLEAYNLLTLLCCLFLAVYCFAVFLDPRRKRHG